VSYYKSALGRKKFIEGTYHGTVYSGDPTKTTWGNTIRVRHYWKFILYKAGITKYELSVGGDDSSTMVESRDVS
jgi:hypothetical protein